MRSLPILALAILIAGCATQATAPVSATTGPALGNDPDRPPIIFVGTPPAGLQQIIGDERHEMVLDGLS